MKSTTLQSQTNRIACMSALLDTMYPKVVSPLLYEREYEFLFAVVLSAQTTDKQVNIVTRKLFEKYKTLKSIAEADLPTFQKYVSSLNLYKTKAKHIIQTANILMHTFHGSVPRSIKELITLPGVGRKSANVVMSELWGKPEGIAVDTHVIRLSQKYMLSRYHDPVKIERDLMQIVPRAKWATFPLQLILYGREYCPARCKKCPTCPLWKCVNPIRV